MRFLFAAILVLAAVVAASAAEGDAAQSQLWGERGEHWDSGGRLPDFSRAGWRGGEDLATEFPGFETVSVRDFGAVPDDGRDDTAAFRRALAAARSPTIIFIPAGTYGVSERIDLDRRNLVLRGAGPGKTILKIDTSLEAIDTRPVKNAGGTPTTSWSWSGGFLRIRGDLRATHRFRVAETASRGTRELIFGEVPQGIGPGERVTITQESDGESTLADHLYADQSGDVSKLRLRVSWLARVEAVRGRTVVLDRPLRADVSPDWEATLRRFEAPVRDCGIERLTIAFPGHEYGGHFRESGYNAIEMRGVADCWVRDVEIRNADSGVFLRGHNCTITDVVFASPEVGPTSRGGVHRGTYGHHGISVSGGSDHLIAGFDFRTVFIHDITVTGSSGNVFMEGRGKNLSLDHHKKAPFANLFTDLDLGEGTRFLVSGGGPALGRHAASWQTFWNLDARQAVTIPSNFGPETMNFVGVPAAESSPPYHFERGTVEPRNLYRAQREVFGR